METGWRGGSFSLQSCLNGLFFIWFPDALYENCVWLSTCKIRGLRAGKEISTEEIRESYGISTGTIRDFSGKFSFVSHSKREGGMLAQQKSRGNKFLARKLQVENLSLRREAVSQWRRKEGKNDRMSFRKQHRTCKKKYLKKAHHLEHLFRSFLHISWLAWYCLSKQENDTERRGNLAKET